MLVLSRKRSEKIWIGDDICITVVRLDRHQVRLGIDAPGHVSIVREEVLMAPEPGEAEPERQRETLAV